MLKSKISFERQINERQYQFLIPSENSFEEIIMILKDMLNQVEVMQKEKMEKTKSDQEKKDANELHE